MEKTLLGNINVEKIGVIFLCTVVSSKRLLFSRILISF